MHKSSGRGRPKGMKQTEEAKLKIKQKRALQIMTEESNKKRSEALKGIKKSIETRLRMAQAMKGKKKQKKGIKQIEL